MAVAAEGAIRIVVVDDHPMIRAGLAIQLSGVDDIEICGEAGDVDEALKVIERTSPDVAVIDIALRRSHGIELMETVARRFPRVRTLALSAYAEDLYAERSLRAGALGYVNKQAPRERVLEAIRTVAKGQRAVSPSVAERLIGQLIGGRCAPSPGSSVEALTNRELEVFRLIGDGVPTGQIARQLHLSPHTIDSHREKIKKKLGLRTGAELQREAIRWVLQR